MKGGVAMMIDAFVRAARSEITPRGDVIEITGRNGSGKSSVLDSLWWALAGAKHIQAVPIRQGATKARIRLDLGELVVERRFTAAGSTVTVTSAEGVRYPSPQGMLDALLGALAFDPLAFVSQEPQQQFESLRAIVQLDIDLDAIDAQNRSDYDRRTELNRQAKAKRAQAAGIIVPNLPPAPIDTARLKDAMAGAAKANAEIEQERVRRREAEREIATNNREASIRTERAAALRAEADRVEAEAAALLMQSKEIQARLDAAPAPGDPTDANALREQLDRAETVNRGFELLRARRTLETEAADLEGKAEALTKQLEERAIIKARALAKAQMPVPGLAFGDGIVTFGGIPFDQASTAEQLRVSVAIAMAANPKLRVIRIKEGSLLDAENLQLIAEMAKEHDYQVWIERVDSSGQVGIVIEDGQVVAVDGTAVAKLPEAFHADLFRELNPAKPRRAQKEDEDDLPF
jgi:DNA repair exonuclease SbcCD ATPase subunit